MNDIVLSQVFLQALVEALAAAGGQLEVAHLRLYKNDITPAPGMVPADFTAPTFAGYAASLAVVWSDPYLTSAGQLGMFSDLKTFTPSDSGVAETIYGAWLTNVGGTEVHAAIRFDDPINVTGPLTPVNVVFPVYFTQPLGGSPNPVG